MRKRGFAVVTSILAAAVFAISGCYAPDETSVDPGPDGSWLAVFPPPYYPYAGDEFPDLVADAAFLVISDGRFEIMYLLETEQVAGQRGTFEVSGGEVLIGSEFTWNPVTKIWISDTREMSFPDTRRGDSFPIESPEGHMNFKRVPAFTRPADFIGSWEGQMEEESVVLNLFAGGIFTFFVNGVKVQSGDDWGVSSTYNGRYMAAHVTDDSGEGAGISWFFLNPYSRSGPAMTMESKDGAILTLTKK